jgi:hypothetical protein
MWDLTNDICKNKIRFGELKEVQIIEGDKIDSVSDY